MANGGYSIVLNIGGNAVRSAMRLADELTRANVAAQSLAATLPAINMGLKNMSSLRGISPAQIKAAGVAQSSLVKAQAAAAAQQARAAAAVTARQTQAAAAARNHSRRQSDPFLSTGFNTPFGRLGRIFTFGENETFLGMNTTKMLRAFNIAGIATQLATSIGKTMLKVVAGSTIAPIAIGGGGLMSALRALQSESFAEGVRLISRRHQAQLGLGAAYEQANRNTDFLAASYGLDRSTALSSINVLTGLGVGGTGRQLSLGEATGLTKVGGLISQHHGVPFERVMTNIQQLLVQTTPHMRDIRELLNQAPILGKYALKEMEEKGVTGVDVRTYLKDQNAIMSVLKRYELDIASNAGMQARGRIALAQQDAWARVAGNDNAWRYIGRAGSGVIGSIGSGMNSLLSTMTDNDAFRIMVKQIENIFDNLGSKGATFVDKLITLIERVAERLDIDLGDRGAAKADVQRQRAYESLANDPRFRADVEAAAAANNGFVDARTPEMRRQMLDMYVQESIQNLIDQPDYLQHRFSSGVGALADAASLSAGGLSNTPYNRRKYNESIISQVMGMDFGDDYTYIPERATADRYNAAGKSGASKTWNWLTGGSDYMYKRGEMTDPTSAFALTKLNADAISLANQKFFSERAKIGSIDPSVLGDKTAETDSMTGVNKDRRALEIHFHAPIVEWNSTIEATSPQETVDEVAVNIEQIAAAAIQKALLGASNKMASRWY